MAWAAAGLVLGVASSWHCVGMCGPFPLHLARDGTRRQAMYRLWLCMGGKAFTYVFLGSLAGFAGEALVRSPALASSQRYVAYLVGAGMVVLGAVFLAGRLPSVAGKVEGIAALFDPACRSLLQSPGYGASLALGMLMGFLPCPATLAALALAAGSQSVVTGAAAALGFGVGTAPALVVLGVTGSELFRRSQRAGMVIAGTVVIVMGLVTIVRGSELLGKVCPFCRAHAVEEQVGLIHAEPAREQMSAR